MSILNGYHHEGLEISTVSGKNNIPELTYRIAEVLKEFNTFLREQGVPEKDMWVIKQCLDLDVDHSLFKKIINWLDSTDENRKDIYDKEIKPGIMTIHAQRIHLGGKLSSYWIKQMIEGNEDDLLALITSQNALGKSLEENNSDTTGLNDDEANELIGLLYDYYCGMEDDNEVGLLTVAEGMHFFSKAETSGGYQAIFERLLDRLEKIDMKNVYHTQIFLIMLHMIIEYRRVKSLTKEDCFRLNRLVEKFKDTYGDDSKEGKFAIDQSNVIKYELSHPR